MFNPRARPAISFWPGGRVYPSEVPMSPELRLVAEFITKVYTFRFKVGSIIPKSVKCAHSATKKESLANPKT